MREPRRPGPALGGEGDLRPIEVRLEAQPERGGPGGPRRVGAGGVAVQLFERQPGRLEPGRGEVVGGDPQGRVEAGRGEQPRPLDSGGAALGKQPGGGLGLDRSIAFEELGIGEQHAVDPGTHGLQQVGVARNRDEPVGLLVEQPLEEPDRLAGVVRREQARQPGKHIGGEGRVVEEDRVGLGSGEPREREDRRDQDPHRPPGLAPRRLGAPVSSSRLCPHRPALQSPA